MTVTWADNYEYPEGKADVKQPYGYFTDKGRFETILSLVRVDNGASGSHICGYARFKSRPVIEQGYGGILTYAVVHGGITYSAEDEGGTVVYGFDCAHAGDDRDPNCISPTWLLDQCKSMVRSIALASLYEEAFLLARSDQQKATVIDSYHDALAERGIEFDLRDNFGAMINVAIGKL